MATPRGVTFVEVDQASLERTVYLLRTFAPKLLVEMRKAIVAAGEDVTHSAGIRLRTLQQTMSMDQTKPWPENAAGKYRVRVTGNLIQLRNDTRGGSIIEFAGRKNPGGLTPRGATLIASLNERYGSTGRLLWHDFDIKEPEVMANIGRIVNDAEDEVNMQLGRVV
jgi:hypothetical protein